jgi:DEAD/DEAH box helicase domain-containing protein
MFVAALLHVDPKRYGNGDAVRKWMDTVETLMPEAMAEKMKASDGTGLSQSCLYGNYDAGSMDGAAFLKQFVAVEKIAVTPPGEPLGVRVGCYLDDGKTNKDKPGFQSGWNGFLRLYNFYQFLPYAFFVTSEGNKAKAYDTITLFKEPDDRMSGAEDAAADSWDAVTKMTNDRFHGLLALLRDNGWPVPEAGYELAGDTGEILACAELGWEALKIAFLTDQEIEYQHQFAAFGWKAVSISEVLSDAQRFMSMKDML